MAGTSGELQMQVTTLYDVNAAYDELSFEMKNRNNSFPDSDDTANQGGRKAAYLPPRNEGTNEVQGQTYKGMVKKSHFIIGICILLAVVIAMVTVGSYLAYNNAKDQTDSEQDTSQEKDGGWSIWSSWDTCSASCQIGEKQRRRQCDSSLPSSSCDGESTESQLCFRATCPDGGWSTWSAWNTCSATCGIGMTQRRRQCNNPAPALFGKSCDGDLTESQLCNEKSCSGIGAAFSVDWPLSIVNNYLTFNTIIYSIGDDFNKYTGKFYCTKPGVYVFSFSLVKLANVSLAECTLAKNDGYFIRGRVNSNGIRYASHTVMKHLNAGDTVGLMNCTPFSMTYVTNFSGFQLYPDN